MNLLHGFNYGFRVFLKLSKAFIYISCVFYIIRPFCGNCNALTHTATTSVVAVVKGLHLVYHIFLALNTRMRKLKMHLLKAEASLNHMQQEKDCLQEPLNQMQQEKDRLQKSLNQMQQMARSHDNTIHRREHLNTSKEDWKVSCVYFTSDISPVPLIPLPSLNMFTISLTPLLSG